VNGFSTVFLYRDQPGASSTFNFLSLSCEDKSSMRTITQSGVRRCASRAHKHFERCSLEVLLDQFLILGTFELINFRGV
jgi:hypothetical protein